jgi:hypothetical protein
MQKLIKRAFVPALMTTAFLGAVLLPASPATARPNWARDIAVGAGTSVVTGAVGNTGSTVGNAATGAATGAAVSATHRTNALGSNRSAVSVVRDAGIGAATSVVTGKIIGNGSAGSNAIKGAAAGTLVNVTSR